MDESSARSCEELVRGIVQSDAGLILEIVGPSGDPVGSLVAITRSRAEDLELAAQFARWRNAAGKWFLTQFTATAERTRLWLSEIVTADPTRILFLMCDSDARHVGHIGLTNISTEKAELDNLIRGEMTGHPRLVEYAERTLLRWAFDSLGVQAVICNNLATNAMVLRLHQALGFRRTARIPLTRRVIAEEIVLEPGEPGAASPDDLYIQQMVVPRNAFLGREDA